MHRQSLGSHSPAAKLHLFAADGVIISTDNDTNFISDDHRKNKLASCSTVGADDEQHKSQKPHQQRQLLISSSTRLVHLIPVLTFICFLILYLSSHDPSRTDLAQFSGIATISSKKTVTDSIGVDDNLEGFLEIRSMRNLQQQEERHRLHRKLGQ
ncbi:hypothetical protein Hanom_Chr13g01221301 [Helianthus anomalus]